MKATIIRDSSDRSFDQPSPLNLRPHNVQFTGADGAHILTFSVKHFPHKLLTEWLQIENCTSTIQNLRGSLRVISKKQGVDVNFSISYEAVHSIARNKVQIEKRTFNCPVLHHSNACRADREFLLALCYPHLAELDPVAADRLKSWALPSFEEVAAMLDDHQRQRAALLLYNEFVA